MSKVLVIPDVHLKPWMFDQAGSLYKEEKCDKIVFLGDLIDDWDQEKNLDLYNETFDRAIAFAKDHQNLFICYGNHDMSYVWDKMESGYSPWARELAVRRLRELRDALPAENCAFIHLMDNVMFSHGGLTLSFVMQHFGSSGASIDSIVSSVNSMWVDKLWKDDSPIWARPQNGYRTYPFDLLHVVGHTPMEAITLCDNVLSTDVFSTYRDGSPIGPQSFVIVDTLSQEYLEIAKK